MAIKSTLEPEIKIELLIKLAFQIPLEDLTAEYNISKNKIINLRKNNYKLYNKFFDYWKIDKQVSLLGLSPKYERALSIVKKFYKNKVFIESSNKILVKGEKYSLDEIIDLADIILKKDNIQCFKQMTVIHNFY